jgi:hypothetical protein
MNPKQPLPKVFEEYHPKPGPRFYQRMETAPWNSERKSMSTRPTHPIRFGWQFAAALLLAGLVLSLSIPAVRAALSAWLGLSLAPSNEMPASAVTLAAPLPTATLPAAAAPAATQVPAAPAANKPAQIVQLSAQAGWNILVPAYLPAGYQYQSAYLDTNHQMVMVTYKVTRPLPGSKDPALTATKTITLLQALKNDFVPMQLAPGAQWVDIQVNGQPGVFVTGAWDTQFVKDEKDPQGGKMVSTWRSDLPIQNLYTQLGKIYVVLLTEDAALSPAELVKVAASLTE